MARVGLILTPGFADCKYAFMRVRPPLFTGSTLGFSLLLRGSFVHKVDWL